MPWDPDEVLRREAERASYWVRRLAKERGLSLEGLAYEAGVARTSVTELWKRAPTLRTISRIAAYLEVDVRDLLRDIPADEG